MAAKQGVQDDLEINKYGWTDWSLDGISIDYDKIIANVVFGENDYHSYVKITFNDFIAIKYIGQWDENIIKSIKASYDGELINEALEEAKKHNSDTWAGGVQNISMINGFKQILSLSTILPLALYVRPS